MTAAAGDATPQVRKKILHVGCGTAALPPALQAGMWEEIRYDIDPAVQPHVVGSMLDMGVLDDGSVDALYSSHNVEHLEAHEVAIALAEFRRVLRPGGTAWIVVPDLQLLAERLAEGDVDGELYLSASGPITVSDVLWGHRASLSNGQRYMAHRYGFSAATLERRLVDAGFEPVRVERNGPRRELIATATRPRDPAVDLDQLFEQARRLHDEGRWSEALSLYTQVSRARPRFWPALLELGTVHFLGGKLTEATEFVRRALALEPRFPRAHLVLGQLHAAAGRPADALESLKRSIELDPTSPAAHLELARLYQERQVWAASEAACRQALRLQPAFAAAGVRLGQVVSAQGRVIEGLSHCNTALAHTQDPNLHGQLLPLLAACEGTTDAVLQQAVRRFNDSHVRPLIAAAQPLAAPSDPARRLRVGYLSASFHRHAIRHLLLPALQRHDREAVEISCYHDSPRLDDVTGQFRALADRWVPCHAVSDAALAERIRADGIDILVDLSGGGEAPRRMVFARRAAPVQVAHPLFGAMPCTGGVDWILGDRWLNPAASGQGPALLELDGPAFCFAPLPATPVVSALPFDRQGAITFGVVAPVSRLQAEQVVGWARLLQRVPASRLYIQCAALQAAPVRQAVLDGFGRLGIDPGRLILKTWADDSPDLSGYHDIDILLDTFTVNGSIAICDALWMGVPVVSRAGTRTSSRVGASLLHAAGLGRWVADDGDAYGAIAAGLAADVEPLRELRRTLRRLLSESELMNAAGHARALEAGYRAAWQRRRPSGDPVSGVPQDPATPQGDT